MKRLTDEESLSTNELEKDLSIQRMSLKKLLEKQEKQDADYYANEIKASLYNRLSEMVEAEIEESNQVMAHLERAIKEMKSTIIINKELIIEALTNFDDIFEEATNEEKRSLLRALIKEIHVEADRKSIKNIVFWFTEDDIYIKSAIPASEIRGTVS